MAIPNKSNESVPGNDETHVSMSEIISTDFHFHCSWWLFKKRVCFQLFFLSCFPTEIGLMQSWTLFASLPFPSQELLYPSTRFGRKIAISKLVSPCKLNENRCLDRRKIPHYCYEVQETRKAALSVGHQRIHTSRWQEKLQSLHVIRPQTETHLLETKKKLAAPRKKKKNF